MQASLDPSFFDKYPYPPQGSGNKFMMGANLVQNKPISIY